ncbi:MAG: aldo/keto reductase [Lachnospiraceae bacterium]|nr:aldo/keto reductase [Lachnospiraceae bacterium]
MIFKTYQDKRLSMLGFGAMRLPLLENGQIDEAQTAEMTRIAIENGVNYFDTAYPYHGGMSEVVMGRILKEYPRDSYYLATKYPGHQIASSYDPAEIFEEQLKKCGVDYFDFYLLHNVYENSIPVYLDPKWGILDYFKEQKKLGRIRHLGFSTHASVPALKEFLDICGEDMEFCQIQLNYLDWTLQDAKAKYALLSERKIPIWVMEPVRGGKLASFGEDITQKLRDLRPEESTASWCFRFLQDLPNVTMVLSGMSDLAQMQDNLKTFDRERKLTAEEKEFLFAVADSMKNSVPCTACRYCCDGCPMGLDIPRLLTTYNEIRILPSTNSIMWLEALPEDKKPSACIGCGKCSRICPQGIDIPKAMEDLDALLQTIPSWQKICREREEAARRLKEGK